jgi:type IV pilus assembly protein PilB
MFISEEDLRRAQEEASRTGVRIGTALIKLGIVDETELLDFLAQQYGVPAVDLRTRSVSQETAGLVTREDALKWLAFPFERMGSVLLVATADPSNVYSREAIEHLTGFDVEMLIASEPAIRAAIDLHYPAELG